HGRRDETDAGQSHEGYIIFILEHAPIAVRLRGTLLDRINRLQGSGFERCNYALQRNTGTQAPQRSWPRTRLLVQGFTGTEKKEQTIDNESGSSRIKSKMIRTCREKAANCRTKRKRGVIGDPVDGVGVSAFFGGDHVS